MAADQARRMVSERVYVKNTFVEVLESPPLSPTLHPGLPRASSDPGFPGMFGQEDSDPESCTGNVELELVGLGDNEAEPDHEVEKTVPTLKCYRHVQDPWSNEDSGPDCWAERTEFDLSGFSDHEAETDNEVEKITPSLSCYQHIKEPVFSEAVSLGNPNEVLANQEPVFSEAESAVNPNKVLANQEPMFSEAESVGNPNKVLANQESLPRGAESLGNPKKVLVNQASFHSCAVAGPPVQRTTASPGSSTGAAGSTASSSHQPMSEESPAAAADTALLRRLMEANARLALENEHLRREAIARHEPSTTLSEVGHAAPAGGGRRPPSPAAALLLLPRAMVEVAPAHAEPRKLFLSQELAIETPAAGVAAAAASCSAPGPLKPSPTLPNPHWFLKHRPQGCGSRPPKVFSACAERRTTVMLRNLPNNYSREMLLDLLNTEGFARKYDFVYLPIDFKSSACLGYAFVNLVDSSFVPILWQRLDGYCNWVLPSKKVCRVSWSGPHQGLEAHVQRYMNSPVMHSTVPDECKPMIFRDGVHVPFPLPTKPPRAPRLR